MLQLAISAADGKLQDSDFDRQFIAPSPEERSGLFPNANANYLFMFFTDNVQAAIFTGTVPVQEPWRAFYGFMFVEQTTTKTVASVSQYDLGPVPNQPSWGSSYQLFAARNMEDAVAAGYDASNIEHKVVLWGDDNEQPGVVFRLLTYFEENTGFDYNAALSERASIDAMDGTVETWNAIGLDSIPFIEYHYF